MGLEDGKRYAKSGWSSVKRSHKRTQDMLLLHERWWVLMRGVLVENAARCDM